MSTEKAQPLWDFANWLESQYKNINTTHAGPTAKTTARWLIEAIRIAAAQRANAIELNLELPELPNLMELLK